MRVTQIIPVDITKLDTRHFTPRSSGVSVAQAVCRAVRSIPVGDHRVIADFIGRVPLVLASDIWLEQLFIALLRYEIDQAKSGATISISAEVEQDCLAVIVRSKPDCGTVFVTRFLRAKTSELAAVS